MSIELFLVFTRGGFVLFSSNARPLEGNPVGRLVSEQLVEERGGSKDDFISAPYSLRWKLDNQREIVYVVSASSTRWRGNTQHSDAAHHFRRQHATTQWKHDTAAHRRQHNTATDLTQGCDTDCLEHPVHWQAAGQLRQEVLQCRGRQRRQPGDQV